MNYTKAQKISLKQDPEISESWVQKIIEEDPSILGLGSLFVKDKERIQPGSGRLDLLLQDEELTKRYEVEIQLGKTDESHIIRTIEYWDVERKRYPQYEHCAVIIAEDITSRFLNVINLFNGAIPLVAIQMNAFRVHDNMTLTFVKVLDQMRLGFVDDDEGVYQLADRAYWENKASKKTLAMADEYLVLIKELSEDFEFKYNKHYIGPAKNGIANNFVIIRPQKENLRLDIKIMKTDETDRLIDESGIELLDYNGREGRYRIIIRKEQVQKHRDTLIQLLKLAYE